jgi:hypothetical protein
MPASTLSGRFGAGMNSLQPGRICRASPRPGGMISRSSKNDAKSADVWLYVVANPLAL